MKISVKNMDYEQAIARPRPEHKNPKKINGNDYTLLEEFASMDDALESTCIEGVKFREVIMDDNTELVGQD